MKAGSFTPQKTEISRRHFNDKADKIYDVYRSFIYELRDPVQLAEEDDFGFIRYALILEMTDRSCLIGNHLDLGCGGGYLMAKLAQRGFVVSGVDLSHRFLDVAKEKFRHYGLKFKELIEADLERMLPFNDNQFDLITSSDVIEHLEDPQKMLFETNRLLINGGYLCISTNNVMSVWGVLKFISERLLRKEGYHPVDNWFTVNKLTKLARNCGFKVIEVRGSYFLPYNRLRKLLDLLGLYKKRTKINAWFSSSIFKYFGRDFVILLRKEPMKRSFWCDPHTGLRRKHTLQRIINRIGVELGIRFRTPYALAWPHYAVIEVTNVCNLHCPLCPTGKGIPGREKGMMRFSDFKKIIDTIGVYLYNVRLENWGEPLLNNEIISMVEYLRKKGIHSAFNTNLLKLDELTAERLINVGLNHIKISFDGINQETYSRYRVGGDFNLLLKNLSFLLEKKKELKSKNPFIELQCLIMKHNEHYIEEMRNLAVKLGVDRLTFTPLRLDMRDELLEPDKNIFMRYKEWLPQNQAYSDFDYSSGKRKGKRTSCDYLWNTAVINYDGSITPCCSVYDVKYDFGNFFKDGFRKVWNGDKYRAARKLIGKGKGSAVEVVCKFCFQKGILK